MSAKINVPAAMKTSSQLGGDGCLTFMDNNYDTHSAQFLVNKDTGQIHLYFQDTFIPDPYSQSGVLYIKLKNTSDLADKLFYKSKGECLPIGIGNQGVYSEIPSFDWYALYDYSYSAGGGSFLYINVPEYYKLLDRYYHESSATFTFTVKLYNPTEDVDYENTFTVTLPWSTNKWQMYNPSVTLQYGESSTLSLSSITIDSSKIQFFNTSNLDSASIQVKDTKMVLPTIHHKINNNYIDIDGTSVVLDTNGKLKAQADIPASLSTTNITATSSLNANRLTGIKSSARYIDFNDNMIKFGLGGYTL